MKDKINIAELLKDCPHGMELDCTSYDNVSFDKISVDKKATYPIFCYITDKEGNRSGISFTENGCESKRYGAKCVIFPKGKTTWEGFQRPFEDGDIVAYDNPYRDNLQVFIFKDKKENNTLSSCYLMLDGDVLDLEEGMYYVTRLATEEEKDKLFNTIKAKGYRWNAKTKTLETWIEPKFKVGDKVKDKNNFTYTVLSIEGWGYILDDLHRTGVAFGDQDQYELVTNKFDITTLKPFESRVLVRDRDDEPWQGHFYSHYEKNWGKPYVCIGWIELNAFSQCIPYESNEHLLGEKDDCDEYYKTWE